MVTQAPPRQPRTSRKGLVAVLTLWTIAMAAVAGALASIRPPIHAELLGNPIFLAEAVEALVLWVLGLPWLFAVLARDARTKRWSIGFGSVALAAAAFWVGTSLRVPEVETLSASADSGDVPGEERTTLIVAVDGMSWTALLPMVRRGELPTFSRLMAEGSYGVLDSLRSYRESVQQWGYWSPVVWTSIATGVSPRRHGIVDFSIPDDGGGEGIAATYHRKAPAFWNLFSSFGRRVGVVGWWATWPAEEVSGAMVSSQVGLRGQRSGSRERSGLTYPPELVEDVAAAQAMENAEEVRRWIHQEIFPFHRYAVLPDRGLETVYNVLWQDRLYLEVAKSLIHGEELDLYAVYFEGVDVLSHQFWGAFQDGEIEAPVTVPQGFDEHRQIVPAYYRAVDGYLAELLALLPDDVTVLVVSDHGFRLDPDHRKKADHGPYGVLLARGPGIASNRNLNLTLLGSIRESIHGRSNVLDILPTLLYLHGLPVADQLPGRVLTELLTPELRSRQPVVRVKSYGDFASDRQVHPSVDPEDSSEYEERLRALGYIQ